MINDFSSLSFSISTSNLSYKLLTSYLPNSYVSSTDISWLRGLTNLKVLNLTGVDLSAASSVHITNWAEPLSVLANLRELSLSDCSIAGPFPLHEFYNLSLLSVFRMDSNPLSSPIPLRMANLTSLSVLDLNNCQLHGSMPYLPQLQYLDVSGNQDLMVDLIHMFDHSWPKLQLLSITLTNVVGPIPSSVSNASSLVSLLAARCSIRVSLPHSLSNLSHLQYLDLSFNSLNGSIPYAISNLRNLQALNLNHNSLHGPFPTSICEVSSLATLLVIGNNLNGSVPSCIFKLRKLQVFDVTGNNLNGTISFN
ncbi:LRR receptor-like serine/threonine-protein kinase ERL1 [Papaver somniferum]|uniref:LRR receptor-like serine/threonine-protein kinase ERL1 n=1 Tax=Papaver somniferum TaxID=3469 RepID=UPI000E6FC437|nr:LRR receptor-like serine/threonine-protein kinase ERL1 [Papaver somniferum]